MLMSVNLKPESLAELTSGRAKDTTLVSSLDFKSKHRTRDRIRQPSANPMSLFLSTVMPETGVQLYAKSYIEGATDFIFGQTGQAWFEQCDIRVPSTTLGYITASGRSSDDSSYYVINNSTVAAADGADVPSGAMYLGRPWEDYARVAFQETDLSDIINSAGWSVWETDDANTEHVSFGEYDNSGAGSEGTRASFSTKLSEPVAIAEVLGSDYESATWVDTSYIS